jgi:putative endonuclease
MPDGGYVYILSSKGKRLYAGVTSQLLLRVTEHKKRTHPDSFTARYNIDSLVYFEVFALISEAIARESAIKSMRRLDKIKLIVACNPTWRDLSEDWNKPMAPFDPAKLRPPTTF